MQQNSRRAFTPGGCAIQLNFCFSTTVCQRPAAPCPSRRLAFRRTTIEPLKRTLWLANMLLFYRTLYQERGHYVALLVRRTPLECHSLVRYVLYAAKQPPGFYFRRPCYTIKLLFFKYPPEAALLLHLRSHRQRRAATNFYFTTLTRAGVFR